MNQVSATTGLITSSQPILATSNVHARRRFWNKCIRCHQHDNVGKDLTGCRHRNRMFSPCFQISAADPRPQRSAGASSQIILLRGTDFTGTTGFVSATFDSLATIKDTKNSTDLLMFDIQKHLETGTGKTTGCTTSYVTEAFTPAAQWLRCHGRQAVLVLTTHSQKKKSISDRQIRLSSVATTQTAV